LAVAVKIRRQSFGGKDGWSVGGNFVLAESDEYLPLDAAAALLHPLITEIILLGILESLVSSWG
jgi:hypothetical protein